MTAKTHLAGGLVAEDARRADELEPARIVQGRGVAVAQATREDLDQAVAGLQLGKLLLDEFERLVGAIELPSFKHVYLLVRRAFLLVPA